jgi:hypothetical protein
VPAICHARGQSRVCSSSAQAGDVYLAAGTWNGWSTRGTLTIV